MPARAFYLPLGMDVEADCRRFRKIGTRCRHFCVPAAHAARWRGT
jgi:hypothetical protein